MLLAIGLAVVFFGVSGLALQGWRGARALEDRMTAIEGVARVAQAAVLRDQRPWVVVFYSDRVVAMPAGTSIEDGPSKAERMVRLADDEKLFMLRIGWKEPLQIEVPEVWRFEPRAMVEPIEVRVESPRGWIIGRFDSLTARLHDTELIVH